MRNNKKRKGFTIVELVIVIAVIGILAAILIPTFINLTARANRASNESFVRNINTQLAMDDAQNKKHETPSSALAAAKAIGFHVDDITPYEGNDIVWDEENDRFAIVKGDFAEAGNQNADHVVFADATFDPATPLHKLWKFYDAMPTGTQTYSIIAKKAWNVTAITDLKVGLDVSNVPGVETVSYVGGGSAKEVIIRTNSANTDLTIDAPLDTVDHHGSVGNVDAQRIDLNHCYNEHGKAAYVKVTEGKVVAKNGGVISVAFAANNDASKVAIIEENGTVEQGFTALQPVSEANKARTGGVDLAYSIDGTTAASMTEAQKTEALVNRETAVVEEAEAAVEVNLIEEIEASGLYEARIGATGYATFDEAISAATNADTVVLCKNVTFAEDRSVPVWTNKGFKLDLNGKTLETKSIVGYSLGNYGYTASAICYSSGQTNSTKVSNGTIKSAYGAGVYADDPGLTLTLENLNVYQNHASYVQSTGEYSTAVRITANANVIINSGTYEGHYSLVVSNSGGHFVINGGTFTNKLFFNASGTTATKTITINEGTFNNFGVENPTKGSLTINGGTFDADPSAYVATGHHANNNGDGTWTVVAD